MPTRHLVFDVNETLLDLSPLDPIFADIFGDADARRAWFANLLHWSTVTSLSGRFMDFGTLAGHCLDQLAASRRVSLGEAGRNRIFSTLATLAPHDDAVPALARLRDAGFSLTALTNSAQATVTAQFEHAGIAGFFDPILSVEAARCYKPHPDAYAIATHTLGVPAADLRLIAAHDWDVTGAMRAGLTAAFVARGSATLNDAGERPDIIGTDLVAVAEQIIAADG